MPPIKNNQWDNRSESFRFYSLITLWIQTLHPDYVFFYHGTDMFTNTVFAIRVMKAFASCGHFPRAFISQQITQRLCAAFLLPIISTSCYFVGCLWPIAVILFLMGTNTSLSSVATESIFFACLASPFWSGSFDWWRTGPRYLVLLS